MLQSSSQDFETTLSTAKETYYVRLHLPHNPDFKDATLFASINLSERLQSIQVSDWLKNFSSTDEFYDGLIELIRERAVVSRSHCFYSSIYFEINLIGLEAVISEDLSQVEIAHNDCVGRRHAISIDIPPNYPQDAAVISNHNLPLAKNLPLGQDQSGFCGKATVLEIYYQFKQLIEKFQEFWNAMETFDMSCWVLEPTEPRLCDFTRRVSIATDCSALLTFNPYQPHQRPSIELRGSQHKVSELRETLAKNLLEDVWDPEVDIYLNILSVLDMQTLPCKEPNTDQMEAALVQPGECGICFEDRHEGEGASERCQNDRCNSQYHQVCLLRYLRSAPNILRIRNAIMGKCPTCRETIGCPINSLHV